MCRYAMYGPYKTHHACFACRKSFKQPPIDDFLAVRGRGYAYKELSRLWSNKAVLECREHELGIRLAELQAEYRDAIHKCPECGQPMIDMGLDFKAPPKTDIKAWQVLHGLYRAGHAFHTCGCNGPGWIPKSAAEYRRYLENRRASYEKELGYKQNATDLSPDRKREAVEYWASRLKAIDVELANIA